MVAAKEGLGGVTATSTSRRELNSAIVILALAALPLSIYVPNAFCWSPFFISSFIPKWNPDLTTLFVLFARTTLAFTIVVHSLNIYVYSFRVPGFWRALIHILSCGYCKNTSFITSQVSASAPSITTDN